MKKKSIADHLNQGTYRADRHLKTSIEFPSGADRPRWLSKLAKIEWDRVSPLLECAGVLKETDAKVLASYCESFAAWREALLHLATHGQVLMVESTTRTGKTVKPVRNPSLQIALDAQRAMLAAAGRFGFDPVARMKLEADINTDPNTNPEAENDSTEDESLFFPDNNAKDR